MDRMPQQSKSFSLGARLRRRREECGMSIADLARVAKIAPHSIDALERADFHAFSAKVYARGVLKKILRALQEEDSGEFAGLLDVEWNARIGVYEEKALIKKSGQAVRQSHRAQKFMAWVGAAVVGLFLFLLVGARLIRFFGAPRLVVAEPKGESVSVSNRVIVVRGEAERESQLTVNGRELTIDESGKFNEKIDLRVGVNRLAFRLTDRFGKVTEVRRSLVVE